MPGVLHTQGIYSPHKEGLLVGREGRRPTVQQRCPGPRAEFYGQAVWKKRTGQTGGKGFMHCTGVVVTCSMRTCVCLRAYTLRVHVLHIHAKLNFPWGLNMRISSGSQKESDNLFAGVTPKKTCRRKKRFATQAGNWSGATVCSSRAWDSFAVQALLYKGKGPCSDSHFWMHFLPRGAKAQGVSVFCRLIANRFWRMGFGNQSWQLWSRLFRIPGQFEDLSLHCLLNSSVPLAFLYLPGP